MTNAGKHNCNCELRVLKFVWAYVHTPIELLLRHNDNRYTAVTCTQCNIFKLHYAQHWECPVLGL